ncbi:Concanavalin A-like lectin/glucanase, subgroup [Phaffia rhodozyma]|uniref:Concanavalin A-like lectin/glucanase, subgroup n=1 Tax=Phaffia rhodozyma TaxID=264483 RepID=A0A0F7SS31_PHARH|nr:Concanavalin A-like lectin/glucanase, subgroup [Phaffia rhodozyma]
MSFKKASGFSYRDISTSSEVLIEGSQSSRHTQRSYSSYQSGSQGSVLDTSLSTKPTVSEIYSLPSDPSEWTWVNDVEADDYLHNPDPKHDKRGAGTILTARGLANIGSFVRAASYVAPNPVMLGAFNLGGVNGSGQVPQMVGNFGLIDRDTPEEAYTVISDSGEVWELQFSDEFNQDGRSFYPGDDPFWEAIDLHAWATNDLEYYDPRMVTTRDGTLEISLDKADPEDNHNLEFAGGSIQGWNKMCFQGGRLEARVRLPATAATYGLWPAFWAMGNLGRVGYGGTLDGTWPYTYDSCDVGTLPNQTLNGLPEIAVTSGTDEATDYALSYLPGQRLSRCTCPDDPTHPGPKHPDGTWKGRAAPEIDVFEAQGHMASRTGEVSLSAQWAPYNPQYDWLNESHMIIEDESITHLNSYKGGPYQQTISGVSTTNQDCYETDTDGNPGCYAVYAFEYKLGENGYIKWFNDDKLDWTYLEGGMGPNAETQVGNRPIPYEPMYIIFNLAMSYNFGPIDMEGLESMWPVKMNIDYVRVYQDPNLKAIGCDPDDAPTAEYIKRYEYAYTNQNMTTWDQMTDNAPKPGNRLLGECGAV